ncbi:LRV domain-containing protein [Cryptosporangium minutisporangium]|uniref:Leucine rich repeat variant n=1 Tax=Cryptosporangium minutisporangium TaxID=113569 RepID=A0ABP6T095_9ACTN
MEKTPPFETPLGRAAALITNPALPVDAMMRILRAVPGAPGEVEYLRAFSDELSARLATHEDPALRMLLGRAPGVTGPQRALLVADPDPAVRKQAAYGPDPTDFFRLPRSPMPAEAYRVVLADPEVAVRLRAALSYHTPDDVRAALTRDPEARVRREALEELERPPRDVLAALLDDPDEQVRVVAERRSQPRDTAKDLREAADPDPWIRARAARDGHLPADVVARLVADPDNRVRVAVSMRPELTEEQRAAIDYHIDPSDRIQPPTWVTDATDPDIVRRCVYSAHVGLRRAAAYNPKLPPDLVAVLAEDEDFIVRLILTESHPEPPAAVLLDVVLRSEFVTRFDGLRHPNFPRTGLTHLADSSDEVARGLVALDRDAPDELIARLARDESLIVRRWMARHARLDPAVLAAFLDDPQTVKSALNNPHLPPEYIEATLADAGI